MGIKSKKKFTVGISYGKHVKKAKTTFETVVLPQLAPNKKATSTQAVKKEKIKLSPEQKAHLNCQSPI